MQTYLLTWGRLHLLAFCPLLVIFESIMAFEVFLAATAGKFEGRGGVHPHHVVPKSWCRREDPLAGRVRTFSLFVWHGLALLLQILLVAPGLHVTSFPLGPSRLSPT